GKIRVAGLAPPLQRDVPLWLEHTFKITRPEYPGAALAKSTRKWAYLALGSALGVPLLRVPLEQGLKALLPGHPPVSGAASPTESPLQVLARRFLRYAAQATVPDCHRPLAREM